MRRDDLTTERLVEAGARGHYNAVNLRIHGEVPIKFDHHNAAPLFCKDMRAALRAILTDAGCDAEGLLDSAGNLHPWGEPDEDTPGQRADRNAAALLRALAGVLRDE